ncbi:MAG: hypothetical protein NC347_13790 [Clostridium sp.]|nr:hypothetical protein [Clostridium sp.]
MNIMDFFVIWCIIANNWHGFLYPLADDFNVTKTQFTAEYFYGQGRRRN